ncbi:hypothetical protein CTI12_AA262800 [Artemisia annua]|uniref:Ubiquitin-like protease family profile domain-containing protein n=1 Tax=Artemisia annua TaxID=35608 RepID=A0A2U1NGS7_ARTAN|nr:hypothetical protein CTI12_AA262800 [Artemisia annua]
MAVVPMKKLKKEDLIQEVRNNERKSINIRMSPRSLKKVLEKLRIPQVEELQKMGFGEFHNNFNFYSTPSELGLWVVTNFESKTCSIKMNNGRKIKITRELVRDILGIPMGDMKVEALEEKNLYEETTAKWREVVEKVDWEFRVAFLVLFFSIFGQGNKDGEVNERIIPILSNTDNVSKMDWCSYVIECMVKECFGYKPNKYFSGPLLLLVIIYVNSTTSETVKVEKTVPAFKAWSSRLLFERQKEELALGFGCLPIVEGEEEGNLVFQLQTPKIDLKYGLYGKNMEEANEDFRSKSFEEMKGIIRDNMVLCNQLMMDTDYKLMIALKLNPEDEDLKKLVETRKDLFAESFKEDCYKNGDDATNGEENDGNGWDNVDDGNNLNEQMGGQNKEDDDLAGEKVIDEEGRKENLNTNHDFIDMNDFLKKVINKEKESDIFGTNPEVSGHDLVGTKYNAIVPFDMDLISSQRLSQSTDENEKQSQEMQYDDLEDIVPLPESQEPNLTKSSNKKRRKLNPEDVTLSQLTWAIEGEQSMNETEMVDKIVKLPFMSTGVIDATKAKKTTIDAAKESADLVIDATPVRSVAPINFVPLENIQKEEEPVKRAKKVARNEEPEKKGRGKKCEIKKEVVKAKKAPTKKAEPKRVQKRGAKAVEEDKEDDILKEKRMVKPSNAMKSPFYDRKVHIYQKWSEAEMKLVEYMWSDSTPESDIVFNGKGLQIEGVFFLSLYPEVEVAAPIIDVWSIILNNEEQFRYELSQKRNVYCSTLMLPHRMVDFDDGKELEKRRKTFEENFNSVLKASGLKDLNDVGLVFFPCIKMTESGSNHYYVICFNLKNGNIDILDNIDNGIEDISVRYGKYAQVLIDTFVNYLERRKYPKVAEIWLAIPRMVPIKWMTTYNAVDCGIFVMRHMEMYVGEDVFLNELQKEGGALKSQLKMLRAKYLAKILLKDLNLHKKKLMKDAEAFAKKQGKKSKILTHIDVKVDENLMSRFNETLVRTLEQ